MGYSILRRSILFVFVVGVVIACRKDPLKKVSKIAGSHAWVGTKYSYGHGSWSYYPQAFDLEIIVLDNNTIVFPYEPIWGMDTLHFLALDRAKKAITFTAQYHYGSAYESSADTMVYYYSGDSITYSREDFYNPGGFRLRVSTKL
jgi:hypothetical protein